MEKPESLLSFYRNQLGEKLRDVEHTDPFQIFDFADCLTENQVQYKRRDFFKIAIMKGDYLYHYADKTLRVSGFTMMFFTPDVPYKFEVLSNQTAGFFLHFPGTVLYRPV